MSPASVTARQSCGESASGFAPVAAREGVERQRQRVAYLSPGCHGMTTHVDRLRIGFVEDRPVASAEGPGVGGGSRLSEFRGG
jgi:hypothetical protein